MSDVAIAVIFGELGDRRSSELVVLITACDETLGESGDCLSSELVESTVATAAIIGDRALSASVAKPNTLLCHAGMYDCCPRRNRSISRRPTSITLMRYNPVLISRASGIR